MTRSILVFVGFAAVATLACNAATASALAQSAREVRGPTPYVAIDNEPAARLIVDAPVPASLARGLVQVQYRVENIRIVPVFGPAGLGVSPRIGHLHITVDDLPWHWADASDSNTIDVVGLPPGPHKVLVELANANHQILTSQTVTFIVPGNSHEADDIAPDNDRSGRARTPGQQGPHRAGLR